MNSQLRLSKIKLTIRQWLFVVLFMGISQVYPYHLNELLASEESCDQSFDTRSVYTLASSWVEKYIFCGYPTEDPSSTYDNSLKSVIISQKFVVKNEEILYVPIVLEASNKHKVDPAMIMAIIMAESGYNSRAVSRKGAKGLMQLMPRTAKWLGVKNIFDPIDNINAGVKYFKTKLKTFNGNVKLALAAYNAGSGNVKKYKGIPPFQATIIYVKKVLKYYQLYKYHMIEAEG